MDLTEVCESPSLSNMIYIMITEFDNSTKLLLSIHLYSSKIDFFWRLVCFANLLYRLFPRVLHSLRSIPMLHKCWPGRGPWAPWLNRLPPMPTWHNLIRQARGHNPDSQGDCKDEPVVALLHLLDRISRGEQFGYAFMQARFPLCTSLAARLFFSLSELQKIPLDETGTRPLHRGSGH